MQLYIEDIGTMIVTRNIERHVPFIDRRRIKFSDQNGLFVKHRPSDEMPVGSDDTASAA